MYNAHYTNTTKKINIAISIHNYITITEENIYKRMHFSTVFED